MRVLTLFCAILVLSAASGRADAAQCRTGHAGLERHVKACKVLKIKLERLKAAK